MKRDIAVPAAPAAHVLLAVLADGDAPALVRQARDLSAGLDASWSVVGIDTPVFGPFGRRARAALLEALAAAEALGARVSRISAGVQTRAGLASSLVHRARSEGATVVMLGRRRRLGDWWTPGSRGLDAAADTLAGALPEVVVQVVLLPSRVADAQRAAPAAASRPHWRTAGLARVLLTLAVCTLAGAALERFVHPANLTMIYLAGVVYVAARCRRGLAVANVAASLFLYDLIFVAPRWMLKPAEPQVGLFLLAMLVVGLVVGQLASRLREEALLAEARAQRTDALGRFAAALAQARDPRAIAGALADAVRTALGVPAAVTLVGDPAERDASLRRLPLESGGPVHGWLSFVPPEPDRDLLEDEHLVRSLATQAALAIERAVYEARSVHTAIEAEGERARNTLLASISHDFRTPLTTIIGSATTLIEQAAALDEAQRAGLLQGMLGEARRLHRMTSNLLDLTRMEEGALLLRPEWCPADELVEESCAPFATRLGGRRLLRQVPDDAVVWCDPRLIGQSLGNLLDNALRHTPPQGCIRIGLDAGSTDWQLSVHDDGPGVPAGHEEAVFRRFYQIDAEGDAAGKGLGLAICAAVARLHGGDIRVVNDAGARFEIRLPQPAAPFCLNTGEPA